MKISILCLWLLTSATCALAEAPPREWVDPASGHRIIRLSDEVSQEGKLFAGDGGGPQSVAAPGNGQWIYLFKPKNGAVNGEKLVDLTSHDYSLEPNVTFTPDRKWIVFRSNIFGETHVYAVEVEKR